MAEHVTDQETRRRAASGRVDAAQPRGAPRAEAPARRARGRSSTCDDINVYYGDQQGDPQRHARPAPQRDHGADRAVGLRQVDVHPLPEPDERPDPGARAWRARSSTTARISTTRDIDPVQVRKRIGMVFQKPNPFPKSIYDNIAFGPRVMGMKGDMDEIVESALRRGGAVGRGQGPAEDERVRHVRRPAAAAVHRARARDRARRAADGRAVLRARPDLDRADRGPDDGAQAATTRS